MPLEDGPLDGPQWRPGRPLQIIPVGDAVADNPAVVVQFPGKEQSA